MRMTTISSREFNQDVSGAKRKADRGPVIITDRGKPAYVLIRHDAWKRLQTKAPRIRELLGMPEVDEIEFEVPRLDAGLFREADL